MLVSLTSSSCSSRGMAMNEIRPWFLGEVTYMVQYIVHSLLFEVVYSLSTDSFIMSLRRYVGCRSNVRMIRSYNGSNVVGASTELTHAFQETFKREWCWVDDMEKKSTAIEQHGRIFGVPDLECKSNFKLLNED